MENKPKICIIGASGFVGRALVERLINKDEVEIKAVIRSPGNAWPILRHGIELSIADVNDNDSIEKAISGCTHVINLSLSPLNLLTQGLTNIINACKKNNITRLVHISSITVYGDLPDDKSKYESGPVLAKKKSYGWYKAQQDKLIKSANENGLSSIVLCPPHITGAYGRVFHSVMEAIKNNKFALVENGKYPCALVDVNNLCLAIELSLFSEKSDGSRIFITNGDNYTWYDLANQFCKFLDKEIDEIPRITKNECLDMKPDLLTVKNLLIQVIKIPELKNLIGKSAIFKNVMIKNSLKYVNNLFSKTKHRNSYVKSKQTSVDLASLEINLCKQQLRNVNHQIDKAKDELSYTPIYNSSESVEIFIDYYSKLYGFNSEYWKLIND